MIENHLTKFYIKFDNKINNNYNIIELEMSSSMKHLQQKLILLVLVTVYAIAI